MDITILGTGHIATDSCKRIAALRPLDRLRIPHRRRAIRPPARPSPATPTRLRAEPWSSARWPRHSLETLAPLADSIGDRVLIDIGNAVDERFDLLYSDSSLGERLQQALPRARVVKTLNTVGGPIGIDPSILSAPTTVFLSGDDADAKATVAGILRDLGWVDGQQIDLGGISTARAAEHYFLLFAALMGALHSPQFNLADTR